MAKALSAFINSAGGVLVFGIGCRKDMRNTRRPALTVIMRSGCGCTTSQRALRAGHLLARAILFECKPQLTDLFISMPLGLGFDKIALAEKRDKTEEVLTLLLEYLLQHSCR
ncbi:hypothetical protein [Mesorhizobium sp. M0187]|uniref:hypothetical protein n=1 Tax=Mesorhizobium sp. M0187 TaxID=2956908 RepID=UPI0033364006